jgi:peptidoglycan/LPS O-acetylase OafA/YrhL
MGQQKLTRIHSLDSLRGAAAFIVVLYHLSLVLPAGSLSFDHNVPFIFSNPWSWIYQTPFLNGPGSVLIFFVLSGLVLALPFFGRDDQRYLPFLIKRVMRIWPPFAAAIIASALLQWLAISRGDANASTLFYANWTIPPTIGVVAQHLDLTQLFVRPINELDNPMWSLVHELRISLIFPLIVFCTFRRPLLSFIGSIGLVFVAAVLIGGRHRELISEIASTIGYIWLFAAGAAIAANLGRVRVAIDGLSSVGTAMMWIFGFSLLAFASSGIQDVDSVPRAFFLLAAGFGAIVVILLCTTENIVTRMLEKFRIASI